MNADIYLKIQNIIKFEDLPDEITLMILLYLDNENLLKMKMINKTMNNIINDSGILEERVSKIFNPINLVSHDNTTFPKCIDKELFYGVGTTQITKTNGELIIKYSAEKSSDEFRLKIDDNNFKIYSLKDEKEFRCINVIVLHKEYLYIFNYHSGSCSWFKSCLKINILEYNYIVAERYHFYLISDNYVYMNEIGDSRIVKNYKIVKNICDKILIMENVSVMQKHLIMYGNKGFFKILFFGDLSDRGYGK